MAGNPNDYLVGVDLHRFLPVRRGRARTLTVPALSPRLVARARKRPAGPSPEKLARGETRLWGEARDGQGNVAVARLRGPQAYRWTALTALAAVERVAAGGVEPGFTTPGGAFGPDFVLGPGVEREDLGPAAG